MNAAVISLVLSFLAVAVPLRAADRPNIVLILADDLGWSDLGCYGADLHETPHLDRLAKESVRFTRAYAMSVCTPSRATLMTGKHAARLQMTIWSEGALDGGPKNRKLLQAESLHDLPHGETTLAEHLRGAGYLTALVGKWHLGDANHFPETQGFDVNIGGTHWGAPETFFWPYSGDKYFREFRYVPHLEFGREGEYLTDRLTDEAMQVIDRAGSKPFFVYLAHHAVHTPMEAKAEDVKHFEEKLKRQPGANHKHAVYAAMVKNLDDNVGRLLEHLKERGLEKNTLVIFTSDNGGFIGPDKKKTGDMPVTSNAPLRSGKGALYEGGIRVPLMVRWPGVASASERSDQVMLADLFHTCMSASGLTPPVELTDGMDLTSLLKDSGVWMNREPLCFHYPHYYGTTTPVGAIIDGEWKLLEYFEDNRVELYKLSEDGEEKHDLASRNPGKAEELVKKLRAWREKVGAKMPTVNAVYREGKGKK